MPLWRQLTFSCSLLQESFSILPMAPLCMAVQRDAATAMATVRGA